MNYEEKISAFCSKYEEVRLKYNNVGLALASERVLNSPDYCTNVFTRKSKEIVRMISLKVPITEGQLDILRKNIAIHEINRRIINKSNRHLTVIENPLELNPTPPPTEPLRNKFKDKKPASEMQILILLASIVVFAMASTLAFLTNGNSIAGWVSAAASLLACFELVRSDIF